MIRSTALFLSISAIAFTQSPAPKSVIRVDVNLVQVDAVVTNSKGKRVSDLQPSDFTLWQDGKPQAITNFSYVSGTKGPPQTAAPQAKLAKGEIPPPPPVLAPTEVRRTLALVVDDLGLAAESIPPVRNAIRKFIDEQMRPGDLVALVRTGAGMGSLQQFTTDKRLLYAALDRVKYGESRVGVSSFAPLGSGQRGGGALTHFREESLAVGTLGALRFVVNEMKPFPGRKSMILFTENIRMIFRGATDEMVAGEVQQLSDAASRASVVIHAIDPRGMPDFSVTAADNTTRMSARRVSRVPAQREQEMIRTEDGMFTLAEQTGGLFLHDDNDLAGALRKAAEDSDGYYLIGYHPDAATFENKGGEPQFHRIEVKVKTAGFHVRSRNGFFGAPGSDDVSQEHSREAQLNRAMQSPFAAGSIHPRLTALFSNLQETGSVIDAMLSFNPKDLKWSEEPDGKHKARVDVAAAAFDENGVALSTVDTTFNLQFDPKQYDEVAQKGMVYGMRIPIQKPGPYLVRAALRDPATEATGSVEQFVEAPDVNAERLALSGIALREADAPVSPYPGPGLHEDLTAGAARRTFRRGTSLAYVFEVLNAQMDARKHPALEVQTRLFHDGTQVTAGPASLAAAAEISDPRRLMGGGRVALGPEMAAGVYVLQVVVTDKLAKNKLSTIAQSMDFEIEP